MVLNSDFEQSSSQAPAKIIESLNGLAWKFREN